MEAHERDQLIVFEGPESFWKAVSPALSAEPAKNNLLLGLAHEYRTNPANGLFHAAVFYGSDLAVAVLCSLHVTNRTLVLSEVRDRELAKRLYTHLRNLNVDYNGIVGETRTVDYMNECLRADGFETVIFTKQRILKCSRVRMPEKSEKIEFRPAVDGDVSLVAEWFKLFHDEAVPHDPDRDWVQAAAARIKAGGIYLLEDAGRPVSTAGWSRDIGIACAVNYVFTPRECRNKGYASIMTALLTEKLLSEGRREVSLFTDAANPTSNKIYEAIGYEFVCDSTHLGIK